MTDGPARPPTSCVPDVFTPGTRFMMLWYTRAVGMAPMMSLVSVCWRFTLCTSTIGVSPDTVTVSSTAPTRKSALTVAVNVPVSSMPSRLAVLKPVRMNVTL